MQQHNIDNRNVLLVSVPMLRAQEPRRFRPETLAGQVSSAHAAVGSCPLILVPADPAHKNQTVGFNPVILGTAAHVKQESPPLSFWCLRGKHCYWSAVKVIHRTVIASPPLTDVPDSIGVWVGQ